MSHTNSFLQPITIQLATIYVHVTLKLGIWQSHKTKRPSKNLYSTNLFKIINCHHEDAIKIIVGWKQHAYA